MSVKRYINSLQGFRFFLFLLIFFFHLSAFGLQKNIIYKFIFSGSGIVAVSGFFVLSGFLSGYKKEQKAFLPFIKKRITQLYPVHFVFFIFVILLEFMIGEFKFQLPKMLMNLSLCQSWNSKTSIWLSYNGVAWFLSTLLFVELISLPLKNRCQSAKYTVYKILGCIVAAVAVTGLAIRFIDNTRWFLYAFPPVRIIDYMGGFWLGVYVSDRDEVSNKKSNRLISSIEEILCIGAILLLCILYPYLPDAYYRMALPFPIMLITVYVLSKQKGIVSAIFSSRAATYLGAGGLYYMMSHQVIMRYVGFTIKHAFPQLTVSPYIKTLLALIITLLSRSIYDFLNSKIKKLYKRIRKKKKYHHLKSKQC